MLVTHRADASCGHDWGLCPAIGAGREVSRALFYIPTYADFICSVNRQLSCQKSVGSNRAECIGKQRKGMMYIGA